MILSLSFLGLEIELYENTPIVLQIESPKIMQCFMKNLHAQFIGEDGDISLVDKGKTLKLDKVAELMTNPYDLDMNNKKVLTKVMSEINSIVDEEFYDRKSRINQEIISLLDEVSNRGFYPIEYNLDIDFISLMKSYNLKIVSENEGLLDYLVNYIQIMSRLGGINTFFMYHLNDYFSSHEIELLIDTIKYDKVYLILIESDDNASTNVEKRIIIDRDECILYT